MKETIPKPVLIEHLNNQLAVIRDHCKMYDSGNVIYAQELAAKFRILFHNQGSNKSLIRQLKLEHVPFVDTGSKFDPHNIFAHSGLINQQTTIGAGAEGGWKWIPKMDKDLTLATFVNWWDGKKVIVDMKKNSFTRRKLILELAETDGGVHVDPSINTEYDELRNKNSMGWFFLKNNVSIPLQNPVPPTIRQIAFEVISTFERISITDESKLHS